MTQRIRRIIFIAVALFAGQQLALGESYLFETLEVPGGYNTVSRSINDLNDTAGFYTDTNTNIVYGFIFNENGYEKLNHPDDKITYAAGINDAGVVVGDSSDGAFIRSASGVYTQITIPDALLIEANGINDAGVVVGSYRDAQDNGHGFLRAADGTITTFDVGPSDSYVTYGAGVNNSGEVVGYYSVTGTGGYFGFVRSPDGLTYTSFRADPDFSTTFFGINNLGQIVGQSNDQTYGILSYVLAPDLSSYTPIIIDPDHPLLSVTDARDINDAGIVTGYYEDAFGDPGFLATPIPSVPEPASMVSLAVGALGLLVVGSRRKASS